MNKCPKCKTALMPNTTCCACGWKSTGDKTVVIREEQCGITACNNKAEIYIYNKEDGKLYNYKARIKGLIKPIAIRCFDCYLRENAIHNWREQLMKRVMTGMNPEQARCDLLGIKND